MDGSSGELTRWEKVSRVYVEAATNYEHRPYPAPVVYFRASRTGARGGQREGWRGILTGQVEVVDVPGNHSSIMTEPEVETLGARMSEKLAEAMERVAE